jgi:hypothetical protein
VAHRFSPLIILIALTGCIEEENALSGAREDAGAMPVPLSALATHLTAVLDTADADGQHRAGRWPCAMWSSRGWTRPG